MRAGAAFPAVTGDAVNNDTRPPLPPTCGSAPDAECEHCSPAQVRQVGARGVVYATGDSLGCGWMLRSGRVKLVTHDTSGREFLLDVFGPGELIGTEACFGDAYQATAVALIDTELCALRCSGKTMTPTQLAFLAGQVQAQLVRARRHQQALGSFRARDKLVRHLLNHLQFDGTTTYYPRHLSLRDMANIVGISAETVCRVLAELEREGIVVADRERIRVLSARRLRVASD